MLRSIHLSMLALAIATAQPIVLKTTTILDGKGHVLRNKQIAVDGHRIASVSDGDTRATYDLSGLTVMPRVSWSCSAGAVPL